MTVLVNCLNLASAGGLSVAINFLSNLPDSQDTHRYIVACPSGVGYEQLTSPQVTVLAQKPKPSMLRVISEGRTFKGIMTSYDVDVIFTLGNFALRSVLPQGLVFMWPYAIYPEGEIWATMSRKDWLMRKLRIWFFRRRLAYANTIFPQTLTSKHRLQKHYDVATKRLTVVSTAKAELENESLRAYNELMATVDEETLVLLCVTRYYPHKNLEVLPEVVRRLTESGLKVKLVLTLENEQHKNVQILHDSFAAKQVAGSVLNLGLLPLNEVSALYRRADALVLPTLLESFSGTFVDAMAAGVPICTSDRDFAHEVCGDAASYFDPLNVTSVTEVVRRVLTDQSYSSSLIKKGLANTASNVTWEELSALYVSELELLVAFQGEADLRT